jgi:hypothetical protein
MPLDEGGVVVFDRDNTDDRNQAVAVTVGASLKLLRRMSVSVFGAGRLSRGCRDSDIGHCEALDSNPVRTRQLLQKLYGFSLIELDLATGRIKLHDALRAFFTAQLYDPEKAHGKLVLSWGDPHKLTETYAWRWIAYHLVGAGWKDQLRELLLDFSWLDAKLHATDVNFLLADFDGLTDEPSLRVVRDALRLSAHVLVATRDSREPALGKNPEGELDLRTRLAEWTTALRGGWLRPTRPTLETPGGPLIRTLEGILPQ